MFIFQIPNEAGCRWTSQHQSQPSHTVKTRKPSPCFLCLSYSCGFTVGHIYNSQEISTAWQQCSRKNVFPEPRVTYLTVKQPMLLSFKAKIAVVLAIRVLLIYTRKYMPRDLCKKIGIYSMKLLKYIQYCPINILLYSNKLKIRSFSFTNLWVVTKAMPLALAIRT